MIGVLAAMIARQGHVNEERRAKKRLIAAILDLKPTESESLLRVHTVRWLRDYLAYLEKMRRAGKP